MSTQKTLTLSISSQSPAPTRQRIQETRNRYTSADTEFHRMYVGIYDVNDSTNKQTHTAEGTVTEYNRAIELLCIKQETDCITRVIKQA